MTDLDLDTATATDAVAALAAGTVGSEELLDAFLARVDERDADLNAVVALDVDRAREQARRADHDRARGASWGPLHGLPMTIKDAYETAGLVTTSGAPELAAHVPTEDADAVALLKGAGAIVYAKTNLPLYAGDMQTSNAVYGTTANPWDLDRSPGGSSGGAAAALASGLTLLELGSDIGGSIRNPSHYCGVFGHKPTFGAVPERGHIPGPPGLLGRTDLGVMGPMGRSTADLVLGLDVLAAGDVRGVPGGHLPAAPGRIRSLADLRIGIWLDDPAAPTDGAVLTVLEAAASTLADAGATVVDDVRTVTSLTEQHLLYTSLLAGALGAGYPDEVIAFLVQQADGFDPEDRRVGTTMTRGMVQRHRDWVHADDRRAHIGREWASVFESVDVMITPVTPVAAVPHDTGRPMDQRTITVDGAERPYVDQLVWAGLATLPYLPATAIPAGRTAAGLPVGLQVVGPEFADRTTLRVAALAEEVLGGFVPPPFPFRSSTR
jgi:amidase